MASRTHAPLMSIAKNSLTAYGRIPYTIDEQGVSAMQKEQTKKNARLDVRMTTDTRGASSSWAGGPAGAFPGGEDRLTVKSGFSRSRSLGGNVHNYLAAGT